MNRTKGEPGSRKGEEPRRMCVICRRMLPKNELTRYGEGRGLYVCREPSCAAKWEKKNQKNG